MAVLYDKYQPTLLNLAMRRGASPDEAHDLIHDVFLSVMAQHRGRELQESYFVSAVLNRFRDLTRKKARQRALLPPPKGQEL